MLRDRETDNFHRIAQANPNSATLVLPLDMTTTHVLHLYRPAYNDNNDKLFICTGVGFRLYTQYCVESDCKPHFQYTALLYFPLGPLVITTFFKGEKQSLVLMKLTVFPPPRFCDNTYASVSQLSL